MVVCIGSPSTQRPRQEDQEFKTYPCYIARLSQKWKTTTNIHKGEGEEEVEAKVEEEVEEKEEDEEEKKGKMAAILWRKEIGGWRWSRLDGCCSLCWHGILNENGSYRLICLHT